VARLCEAGAVLIGKNTTPEFGWKATTDSALTGITRNPWNVEKTPGGSSGGSAAALAARFCPLALGTDGGGSIRIPASFSGVFGLKPSFGRVPAFPLSPFGTVAHVGPMSRTVLDAAMLLNVISKPDARDSLALPYEPTDYAAALETTMRGKRIAFSPRLGHVKRMVLEVETLAAAAARRFEQLGAHVEEVDPPGGNPKETFRTLWWSSAAFLLRDMPEEKRKMLDPALRQIAEEGACISLMDYLSANAARGLYASNMRQFMEHYDFLLTPSVATAAFEVGQLTPLNEDGTAWLDWTPFSFPFNMTLQPAASIPCGFTQSGLPVGLHIAGRMFDDAGVLAAAAAYEMIDPHFMKTPPGF
jgi:aspartyl-tRNA(Asn)/glutamyl-tRNA(Gln) amidotransferase subunit A